MKNFQKNQNHLQNEKANPNTLATPKPSLAEYVQTQCDALQKQTNKEIEYAPPIKNFMIDFNHSYMYCYNYKVGSTSWATGLVKQYNWAEWKGEYQVFQ